MIKNEDKPDRDSIVLEHVDCDPANTKDLQNIYSTSAQRLQRWSNIVQMFYKCFVFAVYGPENTRY